MVLAKQTYRLTDTSDPNTIEDEINAAIEEQEKELQEAIDQAQEAVDKSDQITADLEETNNKIDNVKIEMDTNIGEINTNIGSINTDIHAINNRLKAPNMIAEPEPFPIMSDYPTTQNSQNINGWARMDNRVNNKEITPKILLWFNAKKETKYTQQIEVRTNGELNSLVFSFYTQSNFTHNEVNATIKQIGQGHYIVYGSWEATQNGDTRVLDIKRLNFTGTYIEFRHPKLEKGEYTPYYLNGKDTVEALKRLEKTSDGLVAQVGNMQVVQPNLIGNKEPMIQLKCFPNNNQSSNDNGWAKFNNTCSGQEILPVSDISLAVQANKKYTQQVEINTDGTLKGLEFTFFANGHNVKKANIVNSSTENSYIAYASWTPSANNNLRCIDIRSITIEGATYVKFRHPKIEEGDYTPYTFKDGFNNLSNSMTKVEMTVQGIQSTVQDNTGKITQVTETVDGLKTKVQDNENKITQVTQTAEGLQTTVQENTGKITEVTQTVDGLNAKIQDNTGKIVQATATINGLQTTVQDNTGKITQNTQTIEGFNRRIQTIDGKVSENTQTIDGMRDFIGELQGGRPNLLQDPTNLANTTYWESKGNGIEVKGETVKITGAWAGIGYKLTKLNGIQQDKKYTLSFDIKISNDAVFDGGDAAQLMFYADSLLHNGVLVKKISAIEKGKWVRVSVTVDADGSQTKSGIMRVECNKRCTAGYFEMQHFKLEEGKEASGFDQNGVGSFTEVIKNINGLKTTVANQQNQITQVSQSTQGVLVKVDDNKQRIGQLAITSQNLQSDIRNLENNTNSKISQLSNNINLRVEKNKVINQINVSTEGILIDGKKIKITGETYIQNGIIKDAMIQSLKVDKITGNKASFVQAAFSDANSSTTINSRGILTKDRNNNTVGLNNGGLEMRDRSGNLVFKAVTRDWLDRNGYDDTALLAALGRRQLTIGLAYNEYSEDDITPVISFKRREYDVGSSTRYYDSMYIEHQDRFRLVTTNYYRAQICDSRNAQNGNTYFSILSDSGKCGILWGDSQMYVKVEERCYSVKDILRRCNLL